MAIPILFFVIFMFCKNDRNNADFNGNFIIVREWARLASLPSSQEKFSLTMTGTMFSREFNGEFTASPSDLKKWEADSPGLNSAAKIEISPNIFKYNISPGGGAAFAEVTIDFSSGKVMFKTYWS